MTLFKADGGARALKNRAEKAIALALRGQWGHAAEVNRAILETLPDDVDARNRLAKAFLEMGRYEESREELTKVLRIAPGNAIARRNLDRLDRVVGVVAAEPERERREVLSLDLFMEEARKSGIAALVELGERAALQRLVGGEPISLVAEGPRLLVRSRRGEYLGRVPPRLAQRLLALMKAGNGYAGAVLGASEREVRIIIREVYQDPSQAGKPSFPTARPDGFRSYVRGRNLVYYDLTEPGLDGTEEEQGEVEGALEERPELEDHGQEEDESE